MAKSRLLGDCINEHIIVTTPLKQPAQLDNGEYTEIPIIIDGVLVDFDDDFILIASPDDDTDRELLDRRHIISIRPGDALKDIFNELMDGASKGSIN